MRPLFYVQLVSAHGRPETAQLTVPAAQIPGCVASPFFTKIMAGDIGPGPIPGGYDMIATRSLRAGRSGRLVRPFLHVLRFSVLLLLAACTATVGRDFAAPRHGDLVLGVTTRNDVEKSFGPPWEQSSQSYSSLAGGPRGWLGRTRFSPDRGKVTQGTHATYAYYLRLSNAPAAGGAITEKKLVCQFWNDKLVGYSFLSSQPKGSTDFDAAKVATLVKGKSTREDVLQLLGEPSGRGGFPITLTPAFELWAYQYRVVEPERHDIKGKQFFVLFDGKGIVRGLKLETATIPWQPAVAPVTPTYIYMPPVKHH